MLPIQCLSLATIWKPHSVPALLCTSDCASGRLSWTCWWVRFFYVFYNKINGKWGRIFSSIVSRWWRQIIWIFRIGFDPLIETIPKNSNLKIQTYNAKVTKAITAIVYSQSTFSRSPIARNAQWLCATTVMKPTKLPSTLNRRTFQMNGWMISIPTVSTVAYNLQLIAFCSELRVEYQPFSSNLKAFFRWLQLFLMDFLSWI